MSRGYLAVAGPRDPRPGWRRPGECRGWAAVCPRRQEGLHHHHHHTSRGRPSIARTLATSHIAQSDAGIAKYEEDSSIISTSRRESAALVYSQSGFAISKLATAAILLIVYWISVPHWFTSKVIDQMISPWHRSSTSRPCWTRSQYSKYCQEKYFPRSNVRSGRRSRSELARILSAAAPATATATAEVLLPLLRPSAVSGGAAAEYLMRVQSSQITQSITQVNS